MGPPLKAAENTAQSGEYKFRVVCFNGAAAKSSGKFSAPSMVQVDVCNRFNGAAAKSSGKLRRI